MKLPLLLIVAFLLVALMVALRDGPEPPMPHFHAGYAVTPMQWPNWRREMVSVLVTNIYERGTEFSDDAIGYELMVGRAPHSKALLEAWEALEEYESTMKEKP